jgi:Zn-dependent alcohol dehydrogenase
MAVESVRLEPPGHGEVLVRVAAAGVCHSGVHLADSALGEGRQPMVLGHEGAGVVEALGRDVTGVSAGDHVVFCLMASCGVCEACRAGHRALCEPAGAQSVAGNLATGGRRLRAADGTALQHGLTIACFVEYVVVSAGSVIAIPAGVPLWQAALLGCGVITAVGAVTHAAGVRIGECVAVIGCGRVGVQVITAEVIALIGGRADHAFEVVGAAAAIRLAWDALRPGGTAVVVGLAPRGVEVSLPAIQFLSEKAIIGSYYGTGDPVQSLPGLVELVRAGRLELADMVSHLIDLNGVGAAMDRVRRGEGDRSVIVIDPELAGATAGGTP